VVAPVFVEIKASITDLQAKLGAAAAEIETLSRKGAGSFAKLEAAGKGALLGIIAGAAVVGVASIKMAGDFQQATNQLITSAGETRANIDLVRKGLLDMSVQVGSSATELAKGMYLIESAGYHGASGLQVLKAATQGAKAEGASFETVANAVTSAMNAYHLPASKAVSVTNQLVATVASGKMRMEDLAAAIGGVLPVAATAGLSLAQVGGAMATMSAQGTPAAVAATYLRQTIGQLENPTKKARNEMAALGLSATDIALNLGKRGLTGTLDILTEAIEKKMGPSGKVMLDTLRKASGESGAFNKALNELPPAAQTYVGALATMVGGTKTMQAALQLSGTHAETFAKNVDKVAEGAKHAGKDVAGWDIVQGNFNQKLAKMEAACSKVAIQLGTRLIPMVEAAATFMANHVTTLEVFAGIIGGALVIAIGAYVGALAVAAAEQISFMALTIQTNMAMLAAIISTETALTVSTGGLYLIFIGIAAALVELAKHWHDIWNAISGFVREHTKLIIAILAVIAPEFLVLIAALKLLHDHWSSIWGAIKAVIQSVKDWISEHMRLIVGTLALIFLPLTLIVVAVKELWTHWHSIWSAVSGFLHDRWTEIKGTFGEFLHWFTKLIGPGLDTFLREWRSTWGSIKSALSSAYNACQPVFHAFSTAIGGIASALGALGGAVSSLGGFLGVSDSHKKKKADPGDNSDDPGDNSDDPGDNSDGPMHTGQTATSTLSGDADNGDKPMHTGQTTVSHRPVGAPAPKPKPKPPPSDPFTDAINAGTRDNSAAAAAVDAHKAAADAAKKAHNDAVKAAAKAAAALKKHLAEVLKAAKDHARSVLTEARDAAKSAAADIGKSIATMTADLNGLKKERADLAASLASGITKDMADSAKLFADAQASGTSDPVGQMIDKLKAQVTQAKAFGDQLKELAKEGASKDLVSQIAAQGADAGGALAKALIDKGPDAVASVSSLMGQVADAGKTAADAIAGQYYDQGIASMDALIKGMKSKEAVLQAQVDRITKILKSLSGLTTVAQANAAASAAKGSTAGATTQHTTKVSLLMDGRVVTETVYTELLKQKQRGGSLGLA
jgi:TP901 family phage tail tape measure protein